MLNAASQSPNRDSHEAAAFSFGLYGSQTGSQPFPCLTPQSTEDGRPDELLRRFDFETAILSDLILSICG